MKTKLELTDPARCSFDLNRDLSISVRERKPGPPERIDGFTLGIVSMKGESPHGGEVHPDGDEILYVISGRLQVAGDTSDPLEIGPGEACIVRQGEWHTVSVLEEAQLIHVTPGPNGDHRPR
jgi:mannose-6-phosphate isomerase-like protein (cupin superfamily)